MGCFKSEKWGNSKQGYWILPIANGRTIIKLAVSSSQVRQGMSPPEKTSQLPRSPVNSQPTNIGYRRQLFGLVDHEQMFWSPLPSGSLTARKNWIKYLVIGTRTLKIVAAVPPCIPHRPYEPALPTDPCVAPDALQLSCANLRLDPALGGRRLQMHLAPKFGQDLDRRMPWLSNSTPGCATAVPFE